VAQSTRPGLSLTLDKSIGEQSQIIEAIASVIAKAAR